MKWYWHKTTQTVPMTRHPKPSLAKHDGPKRRCAELRRACGRRVKTRRRRQRWSRSVAGEGDRGRRRRTLCWVGLLKSSAPGTRASSRTGFQGGPASLAASNGATSSIPASSASLSLVGQWCYCHILLLYVSIFAFAFWGFELRTDFRFSWFWRLEHYEFGEFKHCGLQGFKFGDCVRFFIYNLVLLNCIFVFLNNVI